MYPTHTKRRQVTIKAYFVHHSNNKAMRTPIKQNTRTQQTQTGGSRTTHDQNSGAEIQKRSSSVLRFQKPTLTDARVPPQYNICPHRPHLSRTCSPSSSPSCIVGRSMLAFQKLPESSTMGWAGGEGEVRGEGRGGKGWGGVEARNKFPRLENKRPKERT